MKLVGIHVGGTKKGQIYRFEQYTTEHANEFKNIREVFEGSAVLKADLASAPNNPARKYFTLKPRLKAASDEP